MPNLWILSAKELNGGIYITRLPKAIVNADGSVQPGIPDNWYFVGPGTNPSVAEYNGTQFILMFTYLSHMNVRIVDIATWPPTEVQPLTISGGPNPPFTATYAFTQIVDAYSFKSPANSDGQVQLKLSPPYLKQVPIHYDPALVQFSVELTPDPSWVPNVGGTTLYYRLYKAPLGSNPVWTLVQDWTTSLDYTYTQPGSNPGSPLQVQFSATVGVYWNPAHPADLNDHFESDFGYPLAFNSLGAALDYALEPADVYTLETNSMLAFSVMSSKQVYYTIGESDSLLQQWVADWFFPLGTQIVDRAGHVQQITTEGTTGGTYPAFESAPTTPDGSAVWTDQGLLATVFGKGTSGFLTVGGTSPFYAEFLSDTMKFGQGTSPILKGGNAAFSIS